ncbi:MAG: zinc-binding dehydrogenase [Candidatus Latescibacteria bacterium]|nr:zinc-binding dehydrogenase [Candidatus Latescibacterota bacterium]
MANSQRIVFTDRLQVSLETFDGPQGLPAAHEVDIETLYSAISSGTELALLTNDQDIDHWQGEPYPANPGYAAVGRITAVGPEIGHLQTGDLVFAPVGHASQHRIHCQHAPVIPLPAGTPPEDAVYARFCSVSMTTLRTTQARPGDGVAVFGLGIVGAMAAQVFQASGYEVAGIDPAAQRRRRALDCGLRHALDPSQLDSWQQTVGTPCRLVVDTSGSVEAIQAATELADKGAEIVLVGVPWKGDQAHPMSDLLQAVFTKYLQVRGGWEWEIPQFPASFSRGSIEQNMQHAVNLFARGQIQAAPLRSHLLKPQRAEEAYMGLLKDKETYHSVVFDWS